MDVARSVEQMVNAGFIYESDFNLFICVICLPDYDIELIVQQKKPPAGVFCHPVNASTDKATYKHRTRQFTAVTTVAPDAENLFQVAYVGTPVVKDHTGYGLATTWKDSLDSKSIVGKQIVGWSTDGQYINLDTTRPLQNMHPDCHVELTWDPLHLAGLADAHLDKEEFEWLSSNVEVCQDLYNKFNWGKSYEELMDASAELEVKFVGLSKTCQTRFSNSKRLVFINIMKSLSAVMSCLQKHQLRNESSYKQKWANEAANLEGLLFNGMRLLHIAGEGDIYNVYGHLINVVQKVQLFPSERVASFDKELEELKQMALHTDHSQCPEKCYWPQYHSAVATYLEDSTIMGVPVTHSKPYRVQLVPIWRAHSQNVN